jgi:DNA-binding NarL/FixJ family response regulator
MSTGLLRLLLVEDDELFRLGLQVRLQQGFWIGAVFSSPNY